MNIDEDQYYEIWDILEYLLKSEFINPEDIDLASAKFKDNFLTIEKKEDFLPFL